MLYYLLKCTIWLNIINNKNVFFSINRFLNSKLIKIKKRLWNIWIKKYNEKYEPWNSNVNTNQYHSLLIKFFSKGIKIYSYVLSNLNGLYLPFSETYSKICKDKLLLFMHWNSILSNKVISSKILLVVQTGYE